MSGAWPNGNAVAPSQERELKSNGGGLEGHHPCVAPSQERELKLEVFVGVDLGVESLLHRSVS